MIDKPKNHRNIQICMENLLSTDLVKTIIQGWYNKFTQLTLFHFDILKLQP